MSQRFKPGIVSHLPGSVIFYGVMVSQSENGDIEIDMKDKIDALQPHSVLRARRRDLDANLTSIEQRSFWSLNGQLCFMGMMASPVASFYSSYLQQSFHIAKVKDLLKETRLIKCVKEFGGRIFYPRPPSQEDHTVRIVSFGDAARPHERGQLGHITGLLLGPLQASSAFFVLSWSSALSKRPVKSARAAEVLAAGQTGDEAKFLAHIFEPILPVKVTVSIIVDSKNLWDSMSSWREPLDRQIRPDMALLRHDYERKLINEMVWIAGTINPADVLTKEASPARSILQLIFNGAKLTISISPQDVRDNMKSLG